MPAISTLKTGSVLAMVYLLLALAGLLHAQDTAPQTRLTAPTPVTPSPSAPRTTQPSSSTTTSSKTTVIPIFYLNVRGDEERGLPYTMFHRDTGSILGADSSATTFVITGTLTDLRTQTGQHPHDASISSRSAADLASASASFASRTRSWNRNETAPPRTVTQGPGTFEYTATHLGEDRTLVNRCKLMGEESASCDLTHVGLGWYTKKDPDFKVGEEGWNTYSYTWTSGGRFGYAPVTFTAGVEKLPVETGGGVTPGGDEEGAAGLGVAGMVEEARGLAIGVALAVGSMAGVFAML